jgi:hypothetical protein
VCGLSQVREWKAHNETGNNEYGEQIIVRVMKQYASSDTEQETTWLSTDTAATAPACRKTADALKRKKI